MITPDGWTRLTDNTYSVQILDKPAPIAYPVSYDSDDALSDRVPQSSPSK